MVTEAARGSDTDYAAHPPHLTVLPLMDAVNFLLPRLHRPGLRLANTEGMVTAGTPFLEVMKTKIMDDLTAFAIQIEDPWSIPQRVTPKQIVCLKEDWKI